MPIPSLILALPSLLFLLVLVTPSNVGEKRKEKQGKTSLALTRHLKRRQFLMTLAQQDHQSVGISCSVVSFVPKITCVSTDNKTACAVIAVILHDTPHRKQNNIFILTL